MEEFKRDASKLPEKKIEKVVAGTVKTKKKNEIHKFIEGMIATDFDHLRSYIFQDVIIPMFKRGISDTVDIMLYGDTRNSKKNGVANKVSYNKYYEHDEGRRRDYNSIRTKTGYDFEEVVIETRPEAEEVLARMDELCSAYGMVSVADFYDLCGLSSNYTDNKYGWTDIRSAAVMRLRAGGYTVKLPRAMPFD